VDSSDEDKGGKKRKVAQLQNWPKELRDIVVPDPGYCFLGADWKAIQWVLCMMEADSPYHRDLLERFYRGDLDPHRFLAAAFTGKDEKAVSAAERQNAKPYTYGRMFGGSPRGLAREAGHKDTVGITVCNAHDRAFRLQEWWGRVTLACNTKGYVQTSVGWRRYFWDWDAKAKTRGKINEVLGTVIQADEADVLKYILGQHVFPTMPEDYEFLTTTHDSTLFQIPDTEQDRVYGQWWLKDQLEKPVPFFEGRHFPAEVKVGMNWKEVS
jgi:DNA polymerase-1